MRSGMAGAWLVELAVDIKRVGPGVAIGEEPGEGVGSAEVRRRLGTVVRTAEHPNFRRGLPGRIGFYLAERVPLRKWRTRYPGDEIAHIGREGCGPFVGERIEGERGAAIGARRTSEPQVDAARG